MIFFIAAYFLIRSPEVQTYLTQKVASYLSRITQCEISVKSVDIVFFDKIRISEITVQTQPGDTLAFIPMIEGTINLFEYNRKIVFFDKISFDKPYIKLYTNQDGKMNIDKLLDAFSGKEAPDTAAMPWKLMCANFVIADSHFLYDDFRSPETLEKFDYNHINFENFNLEINDAEIKNEQIRFGIHHLNFKEKKGFTLDHFSAFISIDPIRISLRNFLLKTGQTELNASAINLRNIDKTDKNGKSRMSYTAWINTSTIHSKDIQTFVNLEGEQTDLFTFSGEFKGNISAVEGRKCKFFYRDKTLAFIDFYARDFDSEKMRFKIKIQKVVTNKKNLDQLTITHLDLPDLVESLGLITLSGEIRYFPDTLFTNLSLDTDAGKIENRLNFANPFTNPLISGTLSTPDMYIGKITGLPKTLGNIRFSAEITGSVRNEVPDLEIRATADYFEFNWVKLRNININGLLQGKNYDGQLSINDPILNLDFEGKVDFNGELPVFDFSAEVFNAIPAKLNISGFNDSITDIAFKLQANFMGDNIDNMDGAIRLENTEIVKSGDIYNLKNIEFFVINDTAEKSILLRSEMMDAEIFGNFKFAMLATQINEFIHHYAPTFSFDTNRSESRLPDFNFKIEVHNLDDICKVFLPSLRISHNSTIEGRYESNTMVLQIDGRFDQIKSGSNLLDDIRFRIFSRSSQVNIVAEINKIKADDLFSIDNIIFNNTIRNDTIKINLNYNNWSKINNSANINAIMTFQKDSLDRQVYCFDIFPSILTVNDTLFDIGRSTIKIEPYMTRFENILIRQKDQYFSLNGILSDFPEDTLHISINGFSLTYINLITNSESFVLGGKLNGSTSITSKDGVAIISADFNLLNPSINHKNLGDTRISTIYNPEDEKLLISVKQIDQHQEILVDGYYIPYYDSINLVTKLKNKNVNFLNAFIGDIVPLKSGSASGKLKINGLLSDPKISGSIFADSVLVYVEAINIDFLLSDTLRIVPDGFVFKKVKIYDPENNVVFLNGKISHQSFSRFFVDLDFQSPHVLAMNTPYGFTSSYFGKAYAEASVKIKGPEDDILIDISANTHKDTKVFIPLSEGSDLEENTFFTFKQKKPQEIVEKAVVNSALSINLNFDITTDAEIQLIFDSKVGDLIRAYGNGKLNIAIDKTGNFSMFGEYVIEQGNYLFTLQDLINKKFDIEKGSSIVWTGDPYDAVINIDAMYRLKKVNIYDLTLLEDDMEKKVPVNCHLMMTNTLANPNLKFRVVFPYSNQVEQLQEQLNNLPEEDINKQVIYLLLMNRFFPLDPNGIDKSNDKISASSVSTNASELLSNQLSHWLSQISNDFDIGFKYRPGDQITTEEYELALSTQMFNNRVSVTTNLGVGGNQNINNTNQNSSNFAGDVLVEAKISKNGKLRAKAYTRSNKDLMYIASPYTQGVGISYREDFDNFNNLLSQYFNRLFGTRHKADSARRN